jgi:hypothetical protein
MDIMHLLVFISVQIIVLNREEGERKKGGKNGGRRAGKKQRLPWHRSRG